MAKATARGNHEVARINTEHTTQEGTVVKQIFLLRSDGKVLRRYTGDLSTGYSIMGSVKVMPSKADEALRLLKRVVSNRLPHTTITKEKHV